MLLRNQIILFFNCAIFILTIHAWEVLQTADQNREGSRSFSFPIHSFLSASEGLIVGAATCNQSKEYALSIYDFSENIFRPYAREQVTLNSIAKQDNPLFNNGIQLLTLMDEKTFALVLQSDPQRVFVTAFPECKDVLASVIIKDENNNEIDSPITVLASGENRIFAASKNGIAMLGIHAETKEVALTQEEFEALKQHLQEQEDEQAIEQFSKEITTKDGKHSRKVTEKRIEQLDYVKIGDDVEINDLHWCSNLKRLYIGASSDTSSRIFVATLENSKLTVRPFAAASLYDVRKIRSMFTTTSLDYLMVQANKDSCVYALPILNFHGLDGKIPGKVAEFHGTLADDKGDPLEAFYPNDRAHIFMGRHFNTIPQSGIVTHASSPMLVGNGPLLAGPIDDILVKDDAVYAIVNKPYENQSAGIYFSQAIFDHKGIIAAWTAWQPKALMQDEIISGMTIIPTRGSLVVVCGESADVVQTIKRTAWVDAKVGDFKELEALIAQHFPKSSGGVQGMFEHEQYLVILGLGKALLFDCDTQAGTLFADEAVQKLGPLTAGAIIAHQHQKLLMLGGLNGVAALDLDNSQSSSKKIGNYIYVRKILVDENYIYILTDQSFERIDLNVDDIACASSAQLADARQITQAGDYGIFLDCVVSQKCALIAHSAGLHRIGNGKDIRLDDCKTLQWQPVAIPDCSGPVISLIPISVSGKPCDWVRQAGQLYIISGSIGNNTARLNRFAVAPITDAPITDATILPLRDFVAKDHISSFVNIGNFTSLFATDGTLFLTTGKERRRKSKFPILVNSFKKNKSTMPLSLDAHASINCIMRHSKSGHWLIGGDFGLIVNE